jgi:hypothetical protein
VWELPLRPGQGLRKQWLLGKILEGMQFSGITTLQTGHPWPVHTLVYLGGHSKNGRPCLGLQVGDPFAAACRRFVRSESGYPQDLRDQHLCLRDIALRIAGSGRNSIYGPGFVDFELAFAKRMKLSERFQLETRIAGYIISDSAGVGNLIGSGIFRVITNTEPDGTTSPRQIQVAMKLSF